MNLLVIAFALFRAADLLSTRLVSPDLQRELNPVIRWLGWRWTIAYNVALVLFSPALPSALLVIWCVFSAGAAIINLWIYRHDAKSNDRRLL